MLRSLVGSEMCIRDRYTGVADPQILTTLLAKNVPGMAISNAAHRIAPEDDLRPSLLYVIPHLFCQLLYQLYSH